MSGVLCRTSSFGLCCPIWWFVWVVFGYAHGSLRGLQKLASAFVSLQNLDLQMMSHVDFLACVSVQLFAVSRRLVLFRMIVWPVARLKVGSM